MRDKLGDWCLSVPEFIMRWYIAGLWGFLLPYFLGASIEIALCTSVIAVLISLYIRES